MKRLFTLLVFVGVWCWLLGPRYNPHLAPNQGINAVFNGGLIVVLILAMLVP